MGLKALITIDLPNTSDEKRKDFYEQLKNEEWTKLPNLSTAWKVSFKSSENQEKKIAVLKEDIKKAKEYSGVIKVNYAIQLGVKDIEIG